MFRSKRACPFGYVDGGGGPGPAKVPKEDTVSIYEATLNKLKLGARAASGLPRASTDSWAGELHDGKSRSRHGVAYCQIQSSVWVATHAPVSMAGLTTTTTTNNHPTAPKRAGDPRPCYVCTSRLSEASCFHCSRECCEPCSRSCGGCQELFCSICSTSNYDERYDQSFCLDCNSKAPSRYQEHNRCDAF